MPTSITPRFGVLCGALLLSCLCLPLHAAPELYVSRSGGAVPVSSLPDWMPSHEAEPLLLKASASDLETHAYPLFGYTARRADFRSLEKGAKWALNVSLQHLGDERVAGFWTGSTKGRLLLVAWVVDGKVTRCEPSRLVGGRGGMMDEASIKVPEGEVRGHPVVLCWEKGVFLPLAEQEASPKVQALRAIFRDDAEALRALLKAGLDNEAVDERGYTLLHHAAGAGALRCLDVLISSGVRLTVLSKDEITPLELAAARGRTAVVEALARQGKVKVAGRRPEAASPLYLAVESGHAETVQALLRLKADPDEATMFVRTAMDTALDGGYLPVVEVLFKREGARSSPLSERGNHYFMRRCTAGDLPMVRFFIEQGMNAKFEQDGHLPLVEAAVCGSPELAQLLLANGAQLNAVDELERSALMMACITGNTAYARVLVEAGATLTDVHPQAGTLLHAAVRSGKVELVELLLTAGASVSAVDKRGLTPLDYGLVTESWDTVAKLVAKGGRLNPKQNFSGEKLEAVIRGDQEQLLAQLIQEGMSPDHVVSKGWSLRRVAHEAKARRCEQLLAAAGARLDLAQPCAVASGGLDNEIALLSTGKFVDPRIPSFDLPAVEMKLWVLVGPDGFPVFSEIEQCTDRTLCVGLWEAVRSWRFTPPLRGGKPVAVWVTQTVRFPSMKERLNEMPKFDVPPKPISQTKPIYPLALRASRRTGDVMVGFIVTEGGRVIMPYVMRSSRREFEQPALDCVRRWRFEPAKYKGEPVRVHVSVPIVFELTP